MTNPNSLSKPKQPDSINLSAKLKENQIIDSSSKASQIFQNLHQRAQLFISPIKVIQSSSIELQSPATENFMKNLTKNFNAESPVESLNFPSEWDKNKNIDEAIGFTSSLPKLKYIKNEKDLKSTSESKANMNSTPIIYTRLNDDQSGITGSQRSSSEKLDDSQTEVQNNNISVIRSETNEEQSLTGNLL